MHYSLARKVRPKMIVSNISLLFIMHTPATLKSQVLSPQSLKSVELVEEAWILLDSSSIFSGWSGYRKIPVFIGSVDNQGVFINPDREVPAGYSQITSDFAGKIFIRNPSGVNFSGAGVGVLVDDIYYRNYVKLNSYSTTFKNDYISFIENYFSIDHLPDSVYLLINSQEYYKSVYFHEAFHIFQQNSKPWQSHRAINYQRPEIAALSCIEGSLLQKAYYTDSNEEAKELIRDFIAVRVFKNSKLTKRQINYEEDYEWIEGGAMYIQSKLLKSMLPLNQVKYIHYLDSLNLHNSINNLSIPGNKEYYYGQCQAFLLDRFYGEKWQTRILLKDVYLTDLLMEAVNYDPSYQEQRLSIILALYNLPLMKREIRAQLRNLK